MEVRRNLPPQRHTHGSTETRSILGRGGDMVYSARGRADHAAVRRAHGAIAGPRMQLEAGVRMLCQSWSLVAPRRPPSRKLLQLPRVPRASITRIATPPETLGSTAIGLDGRQSTK